MGLHGRRELCGGDVVQVKTKRAASIAILSVVSCVLLAQATDYERQAMQYMARIGRGDAVKRSLTIDGGFIRVGFTDGGRLSYSGSTPTIVRYSNTDDTMEAARIRWKPRGGRRPKRRDCRSSKPKSVLGAFCLQVRRDRSGESRSRGGSNPGCGKVAATTPSRSAGCTTVSRGRATASRSNSMRTTERSSPCAR